MTIKIDFIKQLPSEIIEMIVPYLNGEDIMQCCQVCHDWCNILDTDFTWRILCRQQGWLKEDEKDINETWYDWYWLNYNWRNGKFKRHQQIVPEGGCLQTGLNEKLVIMSHVLGSQVWKFSSSSSSFQQEIYCGDFHFQTKTSDKSIVIRLRDSIQIYNKDKFSQYYNNTKTISIKPESSDYDPDLNLDSAEIQTGCDRLVVIQKNMKVHKILLWNLIDGFKYESLFLDDCVKHIFKILLAYNKMYLVVLQENQYKIKIYNFNNESWSYELTAFKNVAFGVIPPELEVSDKLIVGFCPVNIDRDLCYGYSPLKVWNSTGELVSSLILNSGRIDYFAFCLSDDLVIYRYSETIVKVWKPITDEEICQFEVQSEIFKIDKSIGSLLVLSYDRYFDVWDYKVGSKLYRVITVEEGDSVIQDRIEINKYYYAKQNRNKKIITVFSFINELKENENNTCNKNFVSYNYKNRILDTAIKSIM